LPHGGQIASLPPAEQFAALELFRGTMVRHSLIASRDDDPRVEPSFESVDWRGFVPHRVATAAVIEDKLPAGVAAALLNRAHTYPDLVLFATATERAMFEAIDGHKTIGQIGGTASFFERLWCQDLIVIDASNSS
jgi:hypothetical protein